MRALLRVPDDAPSILELPTDRVSESDLSDVLWRDPSGIDILLAPPRVEMAEMVSVRDVEKMLSILRRVYSVIVIDTPDLGRRDGHGLLRRQRRGHRARDLRLDDDRQHAGDDRVLPGHRLPADQGALPAQPGGFDGRHRPGCAGRGPRREPEFSLISDGRLVVEANNQGVPFVLADPAARISADMASHRRRRPQPDCPGRAGRRGPQALRAMPDPRPIGFFDSGVGGLTVLREVLRRLPGETTIYLGDNARAPYGPRADDEVIRFSLQCLDDLAARDVKAIVVACNTSSAVALPTMRARYDVPILGVVRPGATAAALATRTRRVGVIATQATVRSHAYFQAIKDENPFVEVYEHATPTFVPLVEAGRLDGDEVRAEVAAALAPLLGDRAGDGEYVFPLPADERIDTLLLGCTHYPLLAPVIADGRRARRRGHRLGHGDREHPGRACSRSTASGPGATVRPSTSS